MHPPRFALLVALLLVVSTAIACPIASARDHDEAMSWTGSCFGVELPALAIPAVYAPAITVPDQTLAGYPVPDFTIPAIDIPAQEVPAQCVVYDDVPVGCLAGVTTPGVTIPGITLVGFTIPPVSLPGAYESSVTRLSSTALSDTQLGASRATVCATRERDGHYSPVYQASASRGLAYRSPVQRSSAYRPPVCVNGECIPSVTVPSLTVPSATLPGVSIDARTLKPARLPELSGSCADVLRGASEIVIDLCADRLFAARSAHLRTTAERTLRRLTRALRHNIPAGAIRVEGHTDDTGDAHANQRLSLRRAQAIERWLVTHGIAAQRIAARGWGETYPTAPNTRWGQAANRRLVLGLTVP